MAGPVGAAGATGDLKKKTLIAAAATPRDKAKWTIGRTFSLAFALSI